MIFMDQGNYSRTMLEPMLRYCSCICRSAGCLEAFHGDPQQGASATTLHGWGADTGGWGIQCPLRENDLQTVSRSTSNYWRDLKGKAEICWAWQRFDLIPCWILISGLTCEANNWERFTNPAKSWPSLSDLSAIQGCPAIGPCEWNWPSDV